ncbi:DNA-(apurinic or apyrimidinic site) lyase [Ophidiomyces ophidiicola]|uniref:DNA-(Apurinic or apyrimidinic site) lyase n=1 Tax=Ophidiomyces ophidiicola TaxID=1387563 RepID=A0ACB8UTS5_9EURO|nr:DNA-(apurinic or apyrimidinic site) lyase [Ophidiomyces ophidiicola]KAI1908784.1 DNA-(apurinic or apyrimidinic site) lyase [Ophidiomyces ophidiicola]KAI1933834.1 DNA-(apurinic or apyrimidinic site) lyase [Ophidiomyces ophidiicola]KAI1937760.1 DNA-(apurinic or apyrimidinic site) lyase [Ophidiomyces ophidiicola]KAI1952339.1 DNA-(apurinic or apyrimidinic site) lyase [Ophidiomyces ophidiicola]KAI1999980.1 DNA-(apurinic or apyrimidinic site) lyase [Ophidiomyces ophidiicola]
MAPRTTRAISRRSDETNGTTGKRDCAAINPSSAPNLKRPRKSLAEAEDPTKGNFTDSLDATETTNLKKGSSQTTRSSSPTQKRSRWPNNSEAEYEDKQQINKAINEEETGATSKRTSLKKGTKIGAQLEEMKPLAPRSHGLRMFVGAHVSASKGVQNAVTNSMHIGGNAFALFLKSQRKWNNPPLQDEHRDQFRALCSEHKYNASKYVLPHGSYLVNLAQEDPDKAKQAYSSFLDDLKRCEALGIKLYNFHPGATVKSTLDSSISRLAKALIAALDETTTVIPVLETTCGHGTTIGGSLEHFRSLIELIPESYHSRLGICLDTCHTFAAGYDLRTPDTWNAFMKEFDEVVGLKFLKALHINDSKTPFGSKRDLHANIGTGFLGLRAFHNVMNDKRLEGLPMILETPIDRPADAVKSKQQGRSIVSDCEHDDSNASETDAPSIKKRTKKSVASKTTPTTKAKSKTRPVMVEDKSVWVREIKLLESLIGMDAESEEFVSLEKELSEEGREERQKQQELFNKKQSKETSKKQKNIRAMFSPKGKTTGKAKAVGRKRKGIEDEDTEG